MYTCCEYLLLYIESIYWEYVHLVWILTAIYCWEYVHLLWVHTAIYWEYVHLLWVLTAIYWEYVHLLWVLTVIYWMYTCTYCYALRVCKPVVSTYCYVLKVCTLSNISISVVCLNSVTNLNEINIILSYLNLSYSYSCDMICRWVWLAPSNVVSAKGKGYQIPSFV